MMTSTDADGRPGVNVEHGEPRADPAAPSTADPVTASAVYSIARVVVRNYRCLRSADVALQAGLNIVVGDNEAGKSTLLEAIHLALTGQLGGRSIRHQLHPHLFNHEVVAEYFQNIHDGNKRPPPEVSIELFLRKHSDLTRLQGTNNSARTDDPGIRLAIRLDDEFADDFREHVARQQVASIPVEYYTAEWLTFANEVVHPRRLSIKGRLIDTTTVVAERGSNRYLLGVVDDHLNATERIDLSLAYRSLKHEFRKHASVESLNKALADRTGEVSSKTLAVALDTTSTGTWENAVVPLLDEVPFSLVGKGEQSSLKLRLALDAAATIHVVLVEEPENHQSHSRLNALLECIAKQGSGKQFVVATHSSFVVNKLGLADVIMFNRNANVRLSELEPTTQRYFQKLPGHDTLRLVLAKRAILVEGPSDELVVQRAYRDRHGSLPLQTGVEVISVGALAFKRFIEIAEVLNTKVVVVTDNDGDPDGVRTRYATGAANVTISVADNPDLPSLEQNLVAVNDLARLNRVLGRTDPSKEASLAWMKSNKTQAALHIFESEVSLDYPEYIRAAIE